MRVARRWTADELSNTLADLTKKHQPKPRVVALPTYPLVGLCRAASLPVPDPEYLFHPHRKWRFDYAWPLQLIAVEVEGGVWTQGRHTRGKGFLEDMEKYNAAVLLGWRVLRFVPDEIHHAIPALQTMFSPVEAFR